MRLKQPRPPRPGRRLLGPVPAFVWRFAASLALLGPLLGCGQGGGKPEGRERIEVEFWHGMGERGHQELLGQFASEYMALHPGVEVRPVFQGLHGALYQKLIAAITAGSPPAMAQMFESWTTRLLDRGRLVPVETYVRGQGGYSEEELSDFFEPFLEDSRWGGELITMPFNKSAYVLQYNADLLRQAGFENAPATWDELRAAARAVSRLQSPDGRPCRGLMIRPQLESFATVFFSAGGQFLDDEGRPTMTSPTARASMDLLMGMIEEGSAVVDRNFPSVVLGTGTLGMYIYSSASFPFNDRYSEGKFEWRAAPVPGPAAPGAGPSRTLFQGMNVGLLSGHPAAVTDAAWGFLRYMLEPEQVARWSMQTGYCPLRRTALEVADIKKYLRENPAYRVPLEVVSAAAFEPKPDFWESWRIGVGDEIAAALQSIKTAENALLEAQESGEDSIRYDSKFPLGRPRHSGAAGPTTAAAWGLPGTVPQPLKGNSRLTYFVQEFTMSVDKTPVPAKNVVEVMP